MLLFLKKYNNQATQSALLKGLTGLLLFLSISFLVRYLGPTGYGVWVLVFGFFQWGLYFDFGISNVLKSKIPEFNAKQDYQTANQYINTSIKLTFLIALVLFLAFYIVVYHSDLNAFFDLEYNKQFTNQLFLLNALFFCINFVLSINKSLFIGALKPVFSELSSTVSQLVFFVAVLIVFLNFDSLSIEHKLLMTTYLNGLLTILISFIFLWYFFKSQPYSLSEFLKIDFKITNKIFKTGFQFMLIQCFMVVIFFTDTYFIARYLDIDWTSVFDVLNRLYQLPLLVITAGISSLWPFFSKKYHEKNHLWLVETFKTFDKTFMLIIIALFIFSIMAPFIIKLWVGNDLNNLIPFHFIVLMSFIVLARIYFTFYANFFNGINQLKGQIIVLGISAIFKIPLTIYVLKLGFGLTGILSILLFFMLIWALYFKLKSKQVINQLIHE